jgi:hypothetical protein
MAMKSMAFWVVALCSSERAQLFGGIYHQQKQMANLAQLGLPYAFAGFLPGLLFEHEDGSDIFPLNIRNSPNYMV